MSIQPPPEHKPSTHIPQFDYTTITGYFLQDDPNTDPSTFDYAATDFGIITSPPNQEEQHSTISSPWTNLASKITYLNNNAKPNETYKLLFLGRHGQGDHNVGEAKYGTKAWDEYWSHLDTDGELVFSDAHLTKIGIAQAETAGKLWKELIAIGDKQDGNGRWGMSEDVLPQQYYVSPLYRCLQTARHTFEKLDLPEARPYKPIIKELVRETIGVHTCDRRSPKSTLEQDFQPPLYTFEPNFAEGPDPLYSPYWRETNDDVAARLRELLDDVFSIHWVDGVQILSLTAHSGAISAMLQVLGHRVFGLQTGAVIPVVVKAVRRENAK